MTLEASLFTPQSYEEWKKDLNDWCLRIAGTSVNDLSDQPYADQHADGMDAHEAAIEALVDNGFEL